MNSEGIIFHPCLSYTCVCLTYGLGKMVSISFLPFQLTQSLKEFSTAKEDMTKKLEHESKTVKDLEEINKSLSKQTSDNDVNISTMNSELQALQDTIIQLRDSVEIKDSELQVRLHLLNFTRNFIAVNFTRYVKMVLIQYSIHFVFGISNPEITCWSGPLAGLDFHCIYEK